ncbi:MAG: HlyD family efflux transporter periplasmic adaptor subunit [Cyanobacteria bacterium P01_F01_bin.153]
MAQAGLGARQGKKSAQFWAGSGRWMAIAGVLLISIGGVWVIKSQGRSPAPAVSEELAAQEPMRVAALGQLEPAGEVVTVAAPPNREGSRLQSLRVKVGDFVEAGQVLAVLDSRDRLRAELIEAKGQVEQARARLALVKAGPKSGEVAAQRATIERLGAEQSGDLRQLEATLERWQAEQKTTVAAQTATITRLQAELANAQAEQSRYQSLYNDGAVSASVYDSKALTVTAAQEQLKAAIAERDRLRSTYRERIAETQAQITRTQGSRQAQLVEAQATLDRIQQVRPEDVRSAQAELTSAEARLAQVQVDYDRTVVTAPMAGQVLEIHRRPGELVTNDTGVLDMGQTQTMEVVAEVYDSDMRHVTTGQTVTVTGDAFEGILRGTVVQLGQRVLAQSLADTDPSSQVDSRVVEVRVRLDQPSSALVSHLSSSQVIVKFVPNSQP